MKIAIDAQPTIEQKTGVGYYTYNLINYLQKIDQKNQCRLILWKLFFTKKEKPVIISNPNFSYKFIQFFPLRVYSKLFKLGVKIPLNIFLKTPDIMFFTNFISYPIKNSKSVIVIYDLSFKKYPSFGEPKNIKFLTKHMDSSIKNADHIITISKNSKKEIRDYYKVSEEKITIAYPAINENIFKPAGAEKINNIREKYNISKNYILYASTLEPRKNIAGIVKAYVSLPEDVKKQYDLVLAGGKGWQDESLLKMIEKAKKEGNKIIQTGYVLEEDLPALYSGASLFLFPSFYEGFGIPILEAFACGCPVAVSNSSSFPEIAGKAALYFDPTNEKSIQQAVERLTYDHELRETLIREGFQQVKKFSWQKTTEETLEVYKEVVGE